MLRNLRNGVLGRPLGHRLPRDRRRDTRRPWNAHAGASRRERTAPPPSGRETWTTAGSGYVIPDGWIGCVLRRKPRVASGRNGWTAGRSACSNFHLPNGSCPRSGPAEQQVVRAIKKLFSALLVPNTMSLTCVHPTDPEQDSARRVCEAPYGAAISTRSEAGTN